MVTNFTPVDIQKFRSENNTANTVLLLIATFTTFVLVILLFILIQKKVKTQSIPAILPTPSMLTNTPTPFPTSPPAGRITPQGTPSGIIEIIPTKSATESSTTFK